MLTRRGYSIWCDERYHRLFSDREPKPLHQSEKSVEAFGSHPDMIPGVGVKNDGLTHDCQLRLQPHVDKTEPMPLAFENFEARG